MNKLLILATLLVIAAIGCQKPDAVILEPGENTPAPVEVTPLTAADTNIVLAAVDSTGLLPGEGLTYAGLLMVNQVTYDAGNGVHTKAYSLVSFVDRTKPLVDDGRTIDWWGEDVIMSALQPWTLNNEPMVRVPHRVHIPSTARDTVFGYLYLRDLTTSHAANALYRWHATRTILGDSLDVSVMSPDDIHVFAPVGGSTLSLNKVIDLRWSGKGSIEIVISVFKPATGRTIPVMKLRPKVNTGMASIDPRLLQVLPRARYFVFTFIIANRTERTGLGLYRDRVLIQAASVHNSYVQLQ